MKAKPILFSTPMVQAILDGRKTQTRRAVNPQPNEAGIISAVTNLGGTAGINVHDKGLAPYRRGDILWVRETWANGCMGGYIYKAEHQYAERLQEVKQWKPSIHMPRAAARIFLRVTDVRVERLQEITDTDAHAEGMDSPSYPIIQYKDLWDDLNAKRGCGWDSNPWVWVYAFERINGVSGND